MSILSCPSIVRFSLEDLELFSVASHDRNAIHLSPEYARKTFYGQEVVFGILGALACAGSIALPSNCTISNISLEFKNPMFVGIDYDIIAVQISPQVISVRLCDGSKTLVKANFTFADRESAALSWKNPQQSVRLIPADADEKELRDGATIKGQYRPTPTAFSELMRRFGIDERRFGSLQLAALLWSSYLVGMEQPGQRGLFCKLELAFEDISLCQQACLCYDARVASLNALNMLRSELRLAWGDQLVARGEAWSILIPNSPRGSLSTVAALLPPSDRLKGKVALVIGASRGLGAMLTTALALQGCTVLANFNRSDQEARQLLETLTGTPGKVILLKGDAADVSWCEELQARVTQEYGRLDFLICNACPPLLPLQVEAKTITRINSYVSQAMALVSVPMAVFLKVLEEEFGWSVVISSLSVDTLPKEWPHYVAVKCAVEALARVAALQYPKANFLLVRPPRLRTDLTNTPWPHRDSILPELAAAKIVERLQSPPAGQVEVFSIHGSGTVSATGVAAALSSNDGITSQVCREVSQRDCIGERARKSQSSSEAVEEIEIL